MRIEILHAWDVEPGEAIAIQAQLRDKVVQDNRLGTVTTIAGVDAGYDRTHKSTRAAVAVLDLSSMQVLETALAYRPTTFPYVPGLLSFREVPAILDALDELGLQPDLLLCDGHGLAHPRRFGLACHLGLICDLPSIGVAKSLLIGDHATIGEQRASWRPVIDAGEVIGAALRTRPGVKPVYVSTGHRISLQTAIQYVLSCTDKYRLPEPIRQAHQLASAT